MEVAKNELRTKTRPKLTNNFENIGVYDMVFLGYPIGGGTPPTAVFTFLEGYDFPGKTIVPFCIHESSRMGHSEKDIAKSCPNAVLLE
jgi:flavodoxin